MRYWYLQLKRHWYARKLGDVGVARFYNSPLPSLATDSQDVEFLAVDIETTSLDATAGEIVSIGWVPMKHGSIILAEACHIVVGIRHEVGQSAIYHNISDEQLEAGERATDMLWKFMRAANGRVLVFHNAQIDMSFLNALSRKLFGAPIVAPIVDTLQWEHKKVLKRYQHIPTDTLRLHACRRRYHLPDYPIHNALSDALATLELLQAQIAHTGENMVLGDILSKGN